METREFLRGKTILIVGATGFLGKVFLEKILREQPDVRCIFTLIRSKNVESAQAKLQSQVISKQLFGLLRERYKESYQEFMATKIVPVVGDVALNDLGIEESLRDELCAKVDIVVNSAATTTFNERYDISMKVNALGSKNVIDFCKRCCNLQLLCHISTAYVNVGSMGTVREEVVRTGERVSYSGGEISLSQIESECNLIKETIEEFKTVLGESWSYDKESKYMKEFGAQRAMKFGWPNAYVFTKAVGELMVDYFREDIPTVIIRPTIIESSLKEPFPGWIEGIRMMDPILIGYGKGRLSFFLADPHLILDVIPVDMVANCMIASIARNSSQCGLHIYHVGSSHANPLKDTTSRDYWYNYFSAHPCTSENGSIVRVKKLRYLESMADFKFYMTLYYLIPFQILYVVDKILLGRFKLQPLYTFLLEKYRFAVKLAHIYEPFLFFKGRFNTSNTQDLWNKISVRDQEIFNFDVKSIDWKHYFLECHIPGLLTYVIGGSK
ncbi:hypothetical protein SUGI_0760010 [Cryptomeria japonica]|nr:hypothetical protein SUGI_0760010 [Cryptomeria japonica]